MGFSSPDLRGLLSSHIKTFLVFVFPLTFLCNQNHLPVMVGKRSSINLLHIIMVGLQYRCHYLLFHRHSIQMPKLIALFRLSSPHMQARGSRPPCSNQRLIKEKKWPIPLILLKIPLNQFPPIFISKTIAPMSSTRSILKVPISLRLQQKDQKRATVKRGQMPLTTNMVFNAD
jgi:hypothetical protein